MSSTRDVNADPASSGGDAKARFTIALALILQARIIRVVVATVTVALVVAAGAHADARNWRVALVGTQPISVSLYRHWEHIEHRLAPRESRKPRRRAVMDFLISAMWVIGEAQERGIRVSHKEVDRAFERDRRAAFPTERSFKRSLRQTGETVADLKFKTRINLLTGKLVAVVDPAEFAAKWRPRTLCAPGFSVRDCGGTLTS